MLPKFSYIRASSLKNTFDELGTDNAVIHAGGTDLLGCLREEIFPADKVVSISNIDKLKGISETSDGGLRIGALTTITEVAENPVIRKKYAGLAKGASEVASPQLRNQGTIGGNLCQKPRCWYYRGEFHCLRKGGMECFAAVGENQFHCIMGSDSACFIVHPSDTAPNLVALNALVHIEGKRGKRKVPVEEFHVPPEVDVSRETVLEAGEVLTVVEVPAPASGMRSSYRKVRARRAWDFALAGVALAFTFSGETVKDCRMVLSGAAPVPWRCKKSEDIMRGNTLDSKTIEKAVEAALEKALPLEKNGYKIPLFQGVIWEELNKMAEST